MVTTVTFAGTDATEVTVVSSTELVATVPAGTVTNLVPDPRMTTRIGAQGGGASAWTQETVATGGMDGGAYRQITATADATGTVALGTSNAADVGAAAPVVPGVQYTASIDARHSASGSGYMRIAFRDADNNQIGQGQVPVSVTSDWQRLSASGLAPAGSVYANAVLVLLGPMLGDPREPVAGDVIGLGRRMVEQGTTARGYIDGDSPDGMWSGEANASASSAPYEGPVDVVVATSSDTVTATDGYTYAEAGPTLSRVVPSTRVGDALSSQTIVFGEGFSADFGTTVTFDDIDLAITPAPNQNTSVGLLVAVGTLPDVLDDPYDVTVNDPINGQSNTLAGAYVRIQGTALPPTVTSVTPPTAAAGAESTFTVTGTNFSVDDTSIIFSSGSQMVGFLAIADVVSETELSFTVPAGNGLLPGTGYGVTVYAPGGQSARVGSVEITEA